MILGLGADLCDGRRIARMIDTYGARFLERVFTEAERGLCDAREGETRAMSYARRWAAKEACAKALGTGIAEGVHLRDIGVERLANGQPKLRLTGGAAVRLAAMTPAGAESRLHLTLSDEPPYAQAFVVIEALRDPAL